MGYEADARVGTEECQPAKVALRLWEIKHFYAAMETPVYAAFTGFPLAWPPGTNGPITVEPVKAPIHSKDDFAKSRFLFSLVSPMSS